MFILLLLFGILTDCLLSILVGLIGRKRHIGFGWSFVISLLLTPFIGLIITLLSDQLTDYQKRNWGCLGYVLSLLAFIIIALLVVLIISFASVN